MKDWRQRWYDRMFFTFVGAGIVMMIMALSDWGLEGFRERLGGFLLGAALAAGGGAMLGLVKAEAEEDIYLLQIIVRVAFMLTAPSFILAELPSFLEQMGVLGCMGLCCLTVVPFGASLIWIILKKRRGK